MIYDKKYLRIIGLYILLTIYFVAMSYVYWVYQTLDSITYTKSFSELKLINGILWIMLIFSAVKHTKKKASSFFFCFKIFLELVPLTVIYAFGDENFIYYNAICLAFFLCEIVVLINFKDRRFLKFAFDKLIISIITIICIFVILYIYYRNGLPTTIALDLFNVYELRRANIFKVGKYINYILDVSVKVFFPVLETKYLLERKYLLATVCFLAVGLLYMYTGNKTYLFSIPLVLITVIWSFRKSFYNEFFAAFSLLFSVLMFITPIFESNSLVGKLESLFVRRTMLLSAVNKFKYYDFFSTNTKMGMAGIFPRWLINVNNAYPEGIGYIIAEKYYGKPLANSNTGFLAEGYMRFGFWGIIIAFLLLAIIFKLIDRLQERTDYSFAIGACIYEMFLLADGHLIDTLFFGNWMFMLLIILLSGRKFVNKDRKSEMVRRKWRLKIVEME